MDKMEAATITAAATTTTAVATTTAAATKTKTIVSFDVGIRNLAYCVLEMSTGTGGGTPCCPKILQWEKISIVSETKFCTEKTKSGKKKGTPCGKKASFQRNNGSLLCRLHRKDGDTALQKEIPLKNISLFNLSVSLIKKLDAVDFSMCSEAIVEAQPNKNPSMKNLSVVLMAYFALKSLAGGTVRTVKFVSPKKKLSLSIAPKTECHLKNRHARNKFYAKIECEAFLQVNDPAKLALLRSFKKTDDLCDCFLQGLWYLGTMVSPASRLAKKCL